MVVCDEIGIWWWCKGDAAAQVGEPDEVVVLGGKSLENGGVELFDAFYGCGFSLSAEGLEGDGAGGDAVCVDVCDDVDGGGFVEYGCQLLAAVL